MPRRGSLQGQRQVTGTAAATNGPGSGIVGAGVPPAEVGLLGRPGPQPRPSGMPPDGGIPASHEQRGRAQMIETTATTLLKRAAACLAGWRSLPQRAPRELPGINIVRGAAGYRSAVLAQCCARHAPSGRAFTGSLIGLVVAPVRCLPRAAVRSQSESCSNTVAARPRSWGDRGRRHPRQPLLGVVRCS